MYYKLFYYDCNTFCGIYLQGRIDLLRSGNKLVYRLKDPDAAKYDNIY